MGRRIIASIFDEKCRKNNQSKFIGYIMEPVKFIVFRYLTQAEFFNIYKPAGTEARGGGQAYIDFPITAISLKKWRTLFSGASSVNESKRARGPCWQLVVDSIGLDKKQ